MQFALIDQTRVEAKPGLKGTCPGCGQLVIAKCGTHRIHHWSHFNKRECDSWWEPETEWHRAWKNKFPVECQEIIMQDQRTSEIHIADVRTAHGLVIEFQHSHIDPQERNARQSFYGNMVWVVDGMRLKSDHQRFFNNKSQLFPEIGKPFNLHRPEDYFPAAWLRGFIPVIFDFRGLEGPEDLYCLFATRLGYAIVTRVSRDTFVQIAANGELLRWFLHMAKEITNVEQQTVKRLAIQRQRQANIDFNKASRMLRYGKGRR